MRNEQKKYQKCACYLSLMSSLYIFYDYIKNGYLETSVNIYVVFLLSVETRSMRNIE